jgi:general stress protein CsbA
MSPIDYLILLLFFPVVLQIILPLMVLCGWVVIKLPALFVMREAKQSYPKADSAVAA